jgi:hypothetical protein
MRSILSLIAQITPVFLWARSWTKPNESNRNAFDAGRRGCWYQECNPV